MSEPANTEQPRAFGIADALALGGAASVVYGAWLAWRPAGFIVGGVWLILAAVVGARVRG